LIEKERVNETLTKTNDPDSRRKSPVKHIDMFIRDFYQYKVNIYMYVQVAGQICYHANAEAFAGEIRQEKNSFTL